MEIVKRKCSEGAEITGKLLSHAPIARLLFDVGGIGRSRRHNCRHTSNSSTYNSRQPLVVGNGNHHDVLLLPHRIAAAAAVPLGRLGNKAKCRELFE